MHLVSIPNSPHFWHSFSGPKNSPCVSQHFFACILMYLHFVSMSRLHPSSLNNFLRSSCFNIELSLSPMCPSISCIHFASYVDFPHWPLHHFLRFYCFNTGTSPASTTSCMHLVSVSKFPPPCARSKKTCTGSITMEFPPHHMEARSRKQVHGSKKQETELRNN